jgi:hypothetical protein
MAKRAKKADNPITVPIHNVGTKGWIADIEPHLIPPNAWSNAQNVRFSKRGVERISGHTQVFGTLSTVPEFVLSVPSASQTYWLYTSLTKAYVYDGAVHTDITRTSGGDYAPVVGHDWNGTILGGVPIINSGTDIPQYWPSLNPAVPLANLTSWTSTMRAKRIIAFGPYLVALNLTLSGVNFGHMLQWSHKADPGTLPTSWDYTNPAVDAGRLELTDIHGGVIVDGELLGNKLIIYKASAIHSLRFIGGVSIFSPELLLSTAGILTSKCATAFDKGTKHLVVTADDILIHAGEKSAQSVVEDKVKKAIFGEIDSTNYVNSFVFDNSPAKEVWFCFPGSGTTYPNLVAIWNYKDDTWVVRDLDAVSADRGAISTSSAETWDSDTQAWNDDSEPWANTSLEKIVVVSKTASKAYQVDSGVLFDTSTPTCFIERLGLAYDDTDETGQPKANFSTRKLCTRIWLKMKGTGQVNVRVGWQDNVQDAVTWNETQTFNPLTEKYLDVTVNGRLMALRIESSTTVYWSLQGYDLEMSTLSQL